MKIIATSLNSLKISFENNIPYLASKRSPCSFCFHASCTVPETRKGLLAIRLDPLPFLSLRSLCAPLSLLYLPSFASRLPYSSLPPLFYAPHVRTRLHFGVYALRSYNPLFYKYVCPAFPITNSLQTATDYRNKHTTSSKSSKILFDRTRTCFDHRVASGLSGLLGQLQEIISRKNMASQMEHWHPRAL